MKITISAVSAIPETFHLIITWSTGKTDDITVSSLISRSAALAPLRDPSVFAQARPGEWGEAVSWPNDIELEAAGLYRQAREQAGTAFPRKEFEAWMTRHELSYAQAAKALGLTRRTIINYNMGHTVIPLTVGLACIGWETLQKRQAA
jgi:hypothetical protein